MHLESVLKFQVFLANIILDSQTSPRTEIRFMHLLYTYHVQFILLSTENTSVNTPHKIPAFAEFEDSCKKQ